MTFVTFLRYYTYPHIKLHLSTISYFLFSYYPVGIGFSDILPKGILIVPFKSR